MKGRNSLFFLWLRFINFHSQIQLTLQISTILVK